MVHVMVARERVGRGPGPPTATTSRARIVDAFLDLLDGGRRGMSMPAVAERAGVSVRTLYRYFPSKDELQRYAAGWLDRRVPDAMEPAGRDVDDARVPAASVAGARRLDARRPRPARHPRRPAAARRAAWHRPGAGRRRPPPAITGARRADVVDLIVAICSSSMFLELVDRMGHDPSTPPTSSPISSS